MRDQRVYGVALILSAVGLLVTAGFHPTGGQMLASRDTFEHVALVNTAVHSLAIGSAWLLLFGMVGLSRRLGLQRVDVTAALVAFAMGTLTVTCAAVIDSLVVPQVGRSTFGADEASRNGLLQLMRYSFFTASALSRVWVAAESVAILLWSVAMLRTGFDRVLPWLGIVVALLGLAGQLSGFLTMNIHHLMLVVLVQGVWLVWTGVLLIRRDAG